MKEKAKHIVSELHKIDNLVSGLIGFELTDKEDECIDFAIAHLSYTIDEIRKLYEQ